MVVRLDDYAMTVAQVESVEGNILIDVDNVGSEKHEVVVVRASESGDLPLTTAGAVNLEGQVIVDRMRPLSNGRFRMMTPDMRFGRYVVFCNLVTAGPDGAPIAHYAAGMRGEFEVKPFAAITQDT